VTANDSEELVSNKTVESVIQVGLTMLQCVYFL